LVGVIGEFMSCSGAWIPTTYEVKEEGWETGRRRTVLMIFKDRSNNDYELSRIIDGAV